MFGGENMKKTFILLLTTIMISTILWPTNNGHAQEDIIEYKEVNTVDEFLNSKEPVSIDPTNLSDSDLDKLANANKNTNEVVNYSKANTANGYKDIYRRCKGGKKTFTTKVSYAAIKEQSNFLSVSGSISQLSKKAALKTTGAYGIVIGGGVWIASHLAQLKGYKGIKISDYSTKTVIRKSPYELPTCGRTAKITKITGYK